MSVRFCYLKPLLGFGRCWVLFFHNTASVRSVFAWIGGSGGGGGGERVRDRVNMGKAHMSMKILTADPLDQMGNFGC